MNKITIRKMEEVTEEELNRFKNFDRLLDDFKHVKVKKRSISSPWLISGGLMVATTAIVIYTISKPITSKPIEKISFKMESTPKDKKVENNIVVPSSSVQKSTTREANKHEQHPPKEKETEVNQGYLAAEPTQGYPHLYSYFDSELRYPAKYVNDSINGIVTATFLINQEGKADQLIIQNSLGDAFDEEVKRLIYGMPKWKPATLNGKPVASKISIPFTFSSTKKVK